MDKEFGRGTRKCATCHWHQEKAALSKEDWIGNDNHSGYCRWRQPMSLWAALRYDIGFHWAAKPTLTSEGAWCSAWVAKETCI